MKDTYVPLLLTASEREELLRDLADCGLELPGMTVPGPAPKDPSKASVSPLTAPRKGKP